LHGPFLEGLIQDRREVLPGFRKGIDCHDSNLPNFHPERLARLQQATMMAPSTMVLIIVIAWLAIRIDIARIVIVL
jgi:hypothetical protein